MRLGTDHDVPRAVLAAFGAATLLAGLAVHNYVSGVYGGAIVSSVGAILAALLGVLTD